MAKKSKKPAALTAPCGGIAMEKMGTFDKYEVDSALSTLKRAEEVRNNPDLMKQVKKLAAVELRALKDLGASSIKSTADLREQYAKKYGRAKDDEDESEDSDA